QFTRNLVAGIPKNQEKAYDSEVHIRRLLHHFSSHFQLHDEEALPVARMLVQALSNIVTSNGRLVSHLWSQYMDLSDEQNILIRLLESPDERLCVSLMVLILNCTYGSPERALMLSSTPTGRRLLIALLDRIALSSEDESGQAFEMGYQVFSQMFDLRLSRELWYALPHPDEVVAPHQTTFLKILDSYLQQSPELSLQNYLFLPEYFLRLVLYARESLRQSLPPSSSAAESSPLLMNPDARLPKVSEALVLVSQCLIYLTLSEHLTETRVILPVLQSATAPAGDGLAELLVDLLRLLEAFLPRIPLGQATGQIGFAYLKRDLVRVLGLICEENKSLQDRIRSCGGIEAVMNLCVIDDRNPYLREHALFTLHHLLKNNPQNQAVVAELEPMGVWDENGVLRDKPGAVRR
ncbi:hypothetical protein BOTBODRAFT_102916, partial [Botryobasidium botryosum FD-172 SS1]